MRDGEVSRKPSLEGCCIVCGEEVDRGRWDTCSTRCAKELADEEYEESEECDDQPELTDAERNK